ncbi:protein DETOXIFICATION 42-like [Actinidia eriantha]|uniref:protein DETOXIFICATION 42-like n=1 Tax=Actinidia eriantha TaxID=165200 RepID=UPI00258317EF|nr:protein DETOXIFICATION 42-like [Actinidia eriantha]XP_057501454.1 protein DETOXIFICATION 42-like [Actinidia eriantha]XP_057501455.1 protein DETOXIFICATION 42-like [Actinidia eriantha]
MVVDAILYLRRSIDKMPMWVFFKDTRDVFKKDELGLEIATIAIPAALALTADPIASLIDTAFIGHIGPVELAAVGVSIAIFNQVSKIAIFPLVSVTTSFVAEDDVTGSLSDNEHDIEITGRSSAGNDEKEELIPKADTHKSSDTNSSYSRHTAKVEHERRHIPSASSALVIGAILGLVQALFLIFAAKPILDYMGIKSDSPMLNPARKYLTLRSLGAPAVLLSLAMQGVFRGFKDTKTPLYATLVGDAANIILDPIFIFTFRMGVSGAAIAHVISQYLISLILLWRLMGQVDLLSPSIKDLQLSRFLKNGFVLLLRVIAATFCVTLAASLAARLGPTSMAAFQICLQVWLATSLLADGLAVAGQAILASAFAKKDFDKATGTASRVLQLSLALGIVLSILVAVILQFASSLFTKDTDVLRLLSLGIPFVAGTQPINALAFVFDGVNFGASDFVYSAYSMVLVSIVSILCLFLLSSSHGFVGLWIALSVFMTLRALAGFWRIGTGTGPWGFLRR